MKLDTQKDERNRIIKLIEYTLTNRDLELECLFTNNNNSATQSTTQNTITHSNFIDLLKRFKSDPNYDIKTLTRLDISFDDNKSKYAGTRISIKGDGAVSSFCNTENLAHILNSTDFETKKRIHNTKTSTHANSANSPNAIISAINIPNYNIKFNIKEETNFNNDNERIKDIIQNLPTELKYYRQKKTFTFIKKTQDFKIDISIVKSSTLIDRVLTVEQIIKENLSVNSFNIVKPSNITTPFNIWWKSMLNNKSASVTVRNTNMYYKNIKDSNVFNAMPLYDVEIEYIYNKTTSKPTFKNVNDNNVFLETQFKNYFKIIGAVTQTIQKTNFIMSNSEKYNVIKQFTDVVVNSVDEKLISAYSQNTLNHHQHKPQHQQQQQQHPHPQNPHRRQHNHHGGKRKGNINDDGDIDFSRDYDNNSDGNDGIDGSYGSDSSDGSDGDAGSDAGSDSVCDTVCFVLRATGFCLVLGAGAGVRI